MKIYDILDESWLKITDLENMFDVYAGKNGQYTYNFNETIYVDAPNSLLHEFTCDCRMHWPLISYKIYGTTRLAWLLLKVNNVQAKDMFVAKNPSDKVKYLDANHVQAIVKSINDYKDY